MASHDSLRCLATVSVPAPDLSPQWFLHQANGEPRGFWARDESWFAHRGVTLSLGAEHFRDGDRFAKTASSARELMQRTLLTGLADRDSSLRFYGGFSFRSDHEASGVWADFPDSLFHLPAIELEGGDSGDTWLRVRALVKNEERDQAFQRLRAKAELLRAEMTSRAFFPGGPERKFGFTLATERAKWETAIDSSLHAIRSGSISKAVMARTMDVDFREGVIDPVDVVAKLWEMNQGSHVFLFEPVPGSAIVGAAPETVATLRDGVFHATAVAGSIRRGESQSEQAKLANQLLASDKDRAEQQIALDDMVARLETVGHNIRTDPQPHVLTLARIQHLETEIRASVPSTVGILDLVRLLHPTAAVCGLPRDAAMAFLEREEPFERGWYAGPVGWFDAEGNGVFCPALRMGVSKDSGWRLFAGAGIVEGSVPALEWEETSIKFEPMLDALRAAGAELHLDNHF